MRPSINIYDPTDSVGGLSTEKIICILSSSASCGLIPFFPIDPRVSLTICNPFIEDAAGRSCCMHSLFQCSIFEYGHLRKIVTFACHRLIDRSSLQGGGDSLKKIPLV